MKLKMDKEPPSDLEAKMVELSLENEKLDELLLKLKEEHDELLSKHSELEQIKQKLDDQINTQQLAHPDIIEATGLLETYETLKAEEKSFKKYCNIRGNELSEELEKSKLTANELSEEDLETLNRLKKKANAWKVELAALTRKTSKINRLLEQVPNRMELREYRLRFTELYNQVNFTYKETKGYFNIYNSLEDTKRHMEKELSLLNSIVDIYPTVTSSSIEDFCRQLACLSKSMRESCSKCQSKLQTEKQNVDHLHAELTSLLECKVAYEKCLVQLRDECVRNEALLAKQKQMEVKNQPE